MAKNSVKEKLQNLGNAPTSVNTENKNMGSHSKENKNSVMLFNKSNYQWMLIGIGFIMLGFILMAGGKSTDPTVFNASELYNFRRITLAPILVILGFVIEGYAILKKS